MPLVIPSNAKDLLFRGSKSRFFGRSLPSSAAKGPQNDRSGFTLIELVITVAIISLLASVALPVGELAVQRTKEQELRRSLRDIREAIDAYKQASDEGRIKRSIGESGYPKKLEDLVEGVEDLKSPKKDRIYLLRRIPRDPFADHALAAAATWGKRSYASPPDDPKEGEDVFDVFSLSPGKGINGQPYREW
jgi:general secretion pathway protein G